MSASAAPSAVCEGQGLAVLPITVAVAVPLCRNTSMGSAKAGLAPVAVAAIAAIPRVAMRLSIEYSPSLRECKKSRRSVAAAHPPRHRSYRHIGRKRKARRSIPRITTRLRRRK